MDLEVVGRHTLLFDDDGMAAFVNSSKALLEWNSLLIDRYDVRHLLPAPLPPRLKRRPAHQLDAAAASLEADLDYERFLDLPSSSSDEQEQEQGKASEPINSGGYRAVAFSYGNPEESAEIKDHDTESGFHPHFSVPENLLQNLPPNEKVHQIIARTAVFVSKNGGQSEIILRVKQGDNPTFGFLMPDHHLHPYFRFLVDHQEILKPGTDKNRSQDTGQTGGALSLLGFAYGSGEDDDGAAKNTTDSKRDECEETTISTSASQGLGQAESSLDATKKDGGISKNPTLPSKEKVPIIKRNHSISSVKTTSTARTKRGDSLDSLSNVADKSQTSLSTTTKIELPILEPTSEMKRVIEKIVEFILKNGREFEAILAEQDRAHGRFPFLLSSNQYHRYYLQVLQNAQESKLPGKVSLFDKHDSVGRMGDKKSVVHKENDNHSFESVSSDIPYVIDRKEKFKMVIGKSKKDEQEPNSRDNQPQVGVSVDAAAAAAILQAATRGIRNPSLDIFTKTSSGNGEGPGSDGGRLSSLSLHSSQPQAPKQNTEASVSVPVAKIIAQTAAIAAAGEADSSEASMTREQKIKAERLKRAKMFAAMIKGGAAPLKSEPLRGLSVEPPGSGISVSVAETGILAGKEREGSSVPFDADNSDKSHKSEEKLSVDNDELRLKRRYRSRSRRHEEEGEEVEEKEEEKGKDKRDHKHPRKKHRAHRSRSKRHEEGEEEEEETGEDKRDHKHPRKKHRSHRSSHSSLDRHKHKRRRHSSSKDADSTKKTKHDCSSVDEHQHSRHGHKYDSSSDEKGYSPRLRHRESSLSENERRHSQHRHKHYSSSDDEEHRCQRRNTKHKSRSHAERETDLEGGEIIMKSNQSKAKEGGVASREASVMLSKSNDNARAPSQPSETTQVSDDLRAKIRAMLMATL